MFNNISREREDIRNLISDIKYILKLSKELTKDYKDFSSRRDSGDIKVHSFILTASNGIKVINDSIKVISDYVIGSCGWSSFGRLYLHEYLRDPQNAKYPYEMYFENLMYIYRSKFDDNPLYNLNRIISNNNGLYINRENVNDYIVTADDIDQAQEIYLAKETIIKINYMGYKDRENLTQDDKKLIQKYFNNLDNQYSLHSKKLATARVAGVNLFVNKYGYIMKEFGITAHYHHDIIDSFYEIDDFVKSSKFNKVYRNNKKFIKNRG